MVLKEAFKVVMQNLYSGKTVLGERELKMLTDYC
jgi:hypothetical protein